MNKKDYIIKGFGLQLLKAGSYSAGVAAVRANNIKPPPDNNYKEGINKLPIQKFTGYVPYWAQLSIPDGSYLYVDTSGNQLVTEYQGIDITTCLISVQMNKNIITTPIQGRNGTIKEYISDGDYHINIKGVFTDTNGVYPEEEVRLLKKICDVPSSIAVVSAWLQQFDINNIVIESFSFPQKEGFYNTQLFEINALSDLPVELFIK